MTNEEAKRYWTAKYEAARNWDDPHWEASERKAHRRYVDALKVAIEALTNVQNMHKGKWNDDVIEVVRCKDCRKQGSDDCPMFSREWRVIMRGDKCVDDFVFHDLTEPNGFCSYGKGDNNE